MEAGRADRSVETPALERLRARAGKLIPTLADRPIRGAAGVRASTPDALPMAGPSSLPGVMLALGARRNGWLLAPLIAETVCAHLAGDPPGGRANLFDPLREFSPRA
jgi:glycine oxidase